MKLAIVRQKYTPYGGAERFVARALDALSAQGVDVEIVAREWEGGAKGVKCDPYYLGRTWRDMGFAHCVRQVIASGRYDLVQSHERIPGCQIFRAGDGVHATWLELSRKPLAWLSPWHRYTLAAEAAMFRHPDLRAVICNSHMVKDDIARRFPEAAGKLHVIYNGVDLEKFHPRLRDEHRLVIREKVGVGRTVPVILFVGSGYERKGVATLLEALTRMATREAEAWIVGRDKDRPYYEQLTRDLGIEQRVHFLGAQADVRPYYGSADIFCLPTLYDPFPNAALEALACGLPVVTTTTCGAAELIKPGKNGLICTARDATMLAAHLDKLCAPMVATAMIESARNSVSALTTMVTVEELLSLYRTLGPAGAREESGRRL